MRRHPTLRPPASSAAGAARRQPGLQLLLLLLPLWHLLLLPTFVPAAAADSAEVAAAGDLRLLAEPGVAPEPGAGGGNNRSHDDDDDRGDRRQREKDETEWVDNGGSEAPVGADRDADDDDDDAFGEPEGNEGVEEEWSDEFDEDEDEDEDDSPYVAPPEEGAGFFNVTEEDGPDADDGADLGVSQLYHREHTDRIRSVLEAARGYLTSEVMVDPFYEPVRRLCRHQHELCADWAARGECDANPDYMRRSCAPVCQSCELLHVKTRCPPPDPTAALAIYPGDLDRMFRRVLADPAFSAYAPRALSRPDFADGDTSETADYALGMWLVVLENIVNTTEADRLIALAREQGYERSSDVGEELEDGTYGDDVNEDRTSTNAWCGEDCLEDPVAQKVMAAIEHITGIPEPNQEPLQQLRYEVGQFYNAHNDFIEYQRERPAGPRILTFFLYLNDVEEGGETRFPRIGLSVKPKLGRAVLWPSVYDHDPYANDLRSDHQALPVVRGIKYGANAWIHQGNIKDDSLDCQ